MFSRVAGYSVLLMEVAPVYLENPSLVIIVLILTYPYLHPQHSHKTRQNTPQFTEHSFVKVLANSDHLNIQSYYAGNKPSSTWVSLASWDGVVAIGFISIMSV